MASRHKFIPEEVGQLSREFPNQSNHAILRLLSALANNDHEVIWLKLKPVRLPRGIPCIILCNLYHPPKGNDQDLINYLYESLTTIEARFTNCGIIILGDFNKLNLSRIKNSFKLCQIVKFPTRGPSSLDLVLTNTRQFYDEPIKRPPFGPSYHLSIGVQPLKRSANQTGKFYTISRDLRPTKRLLMRKYLEKVNIPSLINMQPSCKAKVDMFETVINYGLDTLLPLQSKANISNDPHWISQSLRKLIKRRQVAIACGNQTLFKSLRNQVNRERKSCRHRFFSSKVEHLKTCSQAEWWKEVKKHSGISSQVRVDPFLFYGIWIVHLGITQMNWKIWPI